ncbi:MAG: class I SAM-dependent methyltransferase [Phycisphaerae bacterium]|nr:class I SAM-dependent methyltransferase [Phycisphaerae bacterium]
MSLLRRWIEVVVEPRRILGLRHLPRYFLEWRRLRAEGVRARFTDLWPQLGDRTLATPFDPHYFFQGAWLARRIAEAMPRQHVDIGSDLRTVGAVSAFVPTTFLDYRPAAISMSNLDARFGDLHRLPYDDRSLESVSCLHVIEHVGLGRYGDPIDAQGSERACRELARVVRPGGRLYVSAPIGRPRVEFNAHRVFEPNAVVAMFAPLSLRSFAWVGDDGTMRENASPADAASASYACGLFEFSAPASAG